MFATAWPEFHKFLQVITLDEYNFFINRYHLFFKENSFSWCPTTGMSLLLALKVKSSLGVCPSSLDVIFDSFLVNDKSGTHKLHFYFSLTISVIFILQ